MRTKPTTATTTATMTSTAHVVAIAVSIASYFACIVAVSSSSSSSAAAAAAAAATTTSTATPTTCDPATATSPSAILLVDDMRPRTANMYRTQDPKYGCAAFAGTFAGCNKTLNLLGGDYGDSGANETLANGRLTMVSSDQVATVGNQESPSHPNNVTSHNYWYAKFNWENDYDLTPFWGARLSIIMPPASDFNITLTQWLPANPAVRDGTGDRGVDTNWILASRYLSPASFDGATPQTLVIPFADFATNQKGGAFDFAHLKDLTFVNLLPFGATFAIERIELLYKNCQAPATSGTVTTGGGQTTTTATATASTAASSSRSGALAGVKHAAGEAVVGVVVVVALAHMALGLF
ncbi:hypothetical protein DFJ73DRAFT_964057 [Zopfochytrium polystomum]|nr:hypothetical protein DFJ73DRAFT_964057 [Zopfochytrium polystomum]